MSLIRLSRPSLVLEHLAPRPLGGQQGAGVGGARRVRALEAGAAGTRARARRPGLPLRGAVAREGGGGAVVRRSAGPLGLPGRPAPPCPGAARLHGPRRRRREAAWGPQGPLTGRRKAAGPGHGERNRLQPPEPGIRPGRAAPPADPERCVGDSMAPLGAQFPHPAPRGAPRARPRDPRPGPGERRWRPDPGLPSPTLPPPLGSPRPLGLLCPPQPSLPYCPRSHPRPRGVEAIPLHRPFASAPNPSSSQAPPPRLHTHPVFAASRSRGATCSSRLAFQPRPDSPRSLTGSLTQNP